MAEVSWLWCGVGEEEEGESSTCGLRGEGKRGREGETMFGGLAKQSDNLVHGINQLICKYVW